MKLNNIQNALEKAKNVFEQQAKVSFGMLQYSDATEWMDYYNMANNALADLKKHIEELGK